MPWVLHGSQANSHSVSRAHLSLPLGGNPTSALDLDFVNWTGPPTMLGGKLPFSKLVTSAFFVKDWNSDQLVHKYLCGDL